MRLSKLANHEVIDVSSGTRYGAFADADIEFDETTGQLNAIVIETGKRGWFASSSVEQIRIPWRTIKTLGDQTLLVDLLKNK